MTHGRFEGPDDNSKVHALFIGIPYLSDLSSNCNSKLCVSVTGKGKCNSMVFCLLPTKIVIISL